MGVQVDAVLENSNAFFSGLRFGDVILEVANVRVKNPSHMFDEISKHEANGQVEIKFLRGQEVLFCKLPLRINP